MKVKDEITIRELLRIGCKRFANNPGTEFEYVEYYLPITGEGIYIDDSRLGAEYRPQSKDYGPIIVLRAPGVMYFFKHITTMEQFKQIYTLLSGRNLPLLDEDK